MAATLSVLTLTLVLAVRGEDACSVATAKLPASVLLLREKLQAASPTCLDSILHSGGSLDLSNDELPRATAGSVHALSACRVPLLLPSGTLAGWRAIDRWVSDDYLAAVLPTSLIDPFVSDNDDVAARDALVAAGGRLDAVGAHEESENSAALGTKRPALAEDPTGDHVNTLATSQFFSNESESALYFARWMGADDMAPLRADTGRPRGLKPHFDLRRRLEQLTECMYATSAADCCTAA